VLQKYVHLGQVRALLEHGLALPPVGFVNLLLAGAVPEGLEHTVWRKSVPQCPLNHPGAPGVVLVHEPPVNLNRFLLHGSRALTPANVLVDELELCLFKGWALLVG
jgi:hypothetical protein